MGHRFLKVTEEVSAGYRADRSDPRSPSLETPSLLAGPGPRVRLRVRLRQLSLSSFLAIPSAN